MPLFYTLDTFARTHPSVYNASMPKEQEQRRKNYSLSVDSSRILARTSLRMGEELEKIVHKQVILDELVALLLEPKVYSKVAKAIKKL